jgi:uncharacterized UBP type Zn finger protein
LLDKIKRHENSIKGPNPGEIFDFELETKLKCRDCNGVKFNNTKTN